MEEKKKDQTTQSLVLQTQNTISMCDELLAQEESETGLMMALLNLKKLIENVLSSISAEF